MLRRSLGAGVIAVFVSMACKVNNEPNNLKAIGMIGKWTVTQTPLDEAGAGRGVCTVFPEFQMVIDSGPPGMSVSVATQESLVCRGASVTTDSLTLDDSLRVLDLGAGPQHAVVFRVTARPEELIAFGWADIDGDSIGGIFADRDTATGLPFGQSTWTATRP
jgi:hypothetical protein